MSGKALPTLGGPSRSSRSWFGRCCRRSASVKLPETPLVLAGAVGGPFGIFFLTPLRNALTLASQSPDGAVLDLYSSVFAGGFAAGWTGGLACVPPSCPQFIVMGPLFHFLKELLQSAPLAVVCSSFAESTISYPSQTINAQMAFNADQALFGGVQVPLWNPFLPWGPGSSAHVLRNIVALSGLRVFSAPCQAGLARAAEAVGCPLHLEAQQFFGDFIASMGSAILSAPLNQLYNFAVTSNEFMASETLHKLALSKAFLADAYLIYDADDNWVGVSPTLGRDLFMRCAYIATLYALFGAIERLFVAMWKRFHR
ncbi:unnamed protein product [Symbiodinium microadriaticum]|nr:unnamed protein product [Symbiodinium microadriaticum]